MSQHVVVSRFCERKSIAGIADGYIAWLLRRIAIGSCVACVALAGCTPLRPAPAGVTPDGAPATPVKESGTAVSLAPPAGSSAAASAPATRAQHPSAVGTAADVSAPPIAGPVAQGAVGSVAATPGGNIVETTKPPNKSPLKPTTPSVAVAPQAPNRPPVTPAPKQPAAPALDMAALEQRLRDTHAIGVFTKLSLKNQVDDLLDQFRAYHHGPGKPPLTQLRQEYDLLLLKVLSLLQDSDRDLAAAISSSREAIWGILIDPDKFAKI
jgi:hypothetical protein